MANKIKFTINQLSNVEYNEKQNKLLFYFEDDEEISFDLNIGVSHDTLFEFSDNTILSLKDILDTFNLEEIIASANSISNSNGLSEYNDDIGTLVEGINKLNPLDPLNILNFNNINSINHEENLTNFQSDFHEKIILPKIIFTPNTSEVFESHLTHGTNVVHGQVIAQDDSYTKATGHFDITGVADGYKGEVTFSIGEDSITIDLPQVGESCTKNIGEDTYTITHDANGHYSYEYTLNSPKDHSNAPVDSHGDKFIDTHIHVTITDSSGDTVIVSGDTVINIVNDGVTAINPDVIIFTPSNEYYVTIALDVSGSMSRDAGTGKSRLEEAKSALITLMEEYKNAGTDTHVNLVLFSNNANLVDNIHSPQDVIDFLNSYTYTSGGTNYEAALNAMLGKVTEGIEHSEYKNQVIFISDGEPSRGNGVPDAWHDLVTGEHAKDLDVFSIGVSSSITEKAQKNLEAICNPEELGQDTGDMYVHVNDLHNLEQTLHDLTNITSGNLAANNVLGADGVDTFYGFVDGNNIEHKIDWTGENDTLDDKGYYKLYLAGDESSDNYTFIRINSHGDYILQVHGRLEDATYNNIKLILEDTDGDRLTLTGTIEIQSKGGEVHYIGEHSFNNEHDLTASYDHIFDATSHEIDIFNFAGYDQKSTLDNVNIFTLDSGSNLINNFTLGEDKILLKDILPKDESLTLDCLMSHLEDGSLVVNEINAHSSEITIALGEHESTVIDINFDTDVFNSHNLSLEEQALFLLNLTNG